MMAVLARRSLLLAALGPFLLGGVGAPAARAASGEGWGAEPHAAQGKLRTVALTIVGADKQRHEFSVELAASDREQQVGLMFRRAIGPDTGMLFPWPRSVRSQMWMENTLIPLDMVFIRTDGVIDSIAENTVPRSLAVVSSSGVVGSTLELQGGLTEKLGIAVGDRVICPALHLAG